MVLNEEQECVVCFERYSRCERVPRILHCNHTFCVPCLESMCMKNSSICAVSCPLCRWITCTRASLGLSGALWVNTDIWDVIGDLPREEEEDVIHVPTVQSTHRPTQTLRCVPRRSIKSKLQRFVKTFYCGAARNFQ